MTGTGGASPGTRGSALFRRPLLSICVTTYNRSAWLAHSIPRFLENARPYGDLVEVVVCDNTSTDDTPTVTARWAGTPGYRVHRNPRNVGMLGNLGVSAAQARGEYVWVIGDDDLLVEGALERILTVIALHPDVELLYTNYAYTCFDRPQDLTDIDDVIHGAVPISAATRDVYARAASEICARSENCFTSIYCLILRADHARGAYGQETSGPPFSSLPTCVPSTHYVIEQLFDRPAYWIGDPCVVVNMNVSWLRYAALYILERFPEIFDRMEERGADPAEVSRLRAQHVPQLLRWVRAVYQGEQAEHRNAFSMERLVRRFAAVPAFREAWPSLRSVYAQAWLSSTVEPGARPPEQLDALLGAAPPPA